MSRGKQTFHHLSHPPIIEAVLEVQAQIPPHITNEDILRLCEPAVASEYHDYQPIRSFTGRVGIANGVPLSEITDLGVQGYIFKNPEKTRALHFRRDGFGYSQLKPYESWDSLLEGAKRWWTVYDRAIPDKTITRVGLRYINRLELADMGQGAHTFLKYPPKRPMEGSFTEFVERSTMVHKPSGAKAVTVQMLEPVTVESSLSIVIDIDVFYDHLENEEPEIWERFPVLRDLKNQYFFGLLKRAAWEPYR